MINFTLSTTVAKLPEADICNCFETQQYAMRVIGDWIQFYNHRRLHQALGMKTPAQAYALAA